MIICLVQQEGSNSELPHELAADEEDARADEAIRQLQRRLSIEIDMNYA